MTRALGPRLIAVLLAFYAMVGVLLTSAMLSGRYPNFQWGTLAAASAVFAIVTGTAALATWRLERRAPAWAIVCGISGAGLMAVIPLSAQLPPDASSEAWRAAAIGAVLFLAFMLVASVYLRAWLRAAGDRTDL